MIYLILSSQEQDDDATSVQIEKEGDDSQEDSSRREDSEYFHSESFVSESEHYKSVEESKFILPDLAENNSINREIKKQKFMKSLINQNNLFVILIKGIIKIFSRPWELLLDLLIPKSSDGIYLMIRFLVPSILIWNVSEIELFILEKLLKRLNLSATYLGLTITAWGNNAPDMFNVASAMSKGMVDLAMNAAIASEIHNVLIGCGLPWLVYNIKMQKPLNFGKNNLYAFSLFIFCFFVLMFIMALKFNKMKLDSKFAVFLILFYMVFFILWILKFYI